MSEPELQPALFELEDDSALLFEPEEMRKRYTAQQADKLERLKTSVLMLLSSWPVEDIARHLHLNTRTVRALAAQSAEKVAGFNKEFGDMLVRTGARWIALARTREQDASFKDLNIGAGIVIEKASALLAMGQVAEERETKEVTDHVQAADALRRLMASGDTISTDVACITMGNEATPASGAGGGAGEAGLGQADATPRGGASDPGSPPIEPMGGGSEGLSTKAAPEAKNAP